ncbi:MAG TPA: amino acid adenylation domain-containing protein [Bryobacteraceae bacterium]|nr:amino acid adenylation domain-containing protein [Bryobacteraceae bacterium]
MRPAGPQVQNAGAVGAITGMTGVPSSQTELSPDQKRDMLVELMRRDASGIRLCPLSLAQLRLWFLEQLEPGTGAHNVSSGLRLRGELDFQALRRAVERIVARHEPLRATFRALRGEVFQRIEPDVRVEIPEVDLRALPDEVREREAYQKAGEEGSKPFDLEHGPLLRLKLIRIRDSENILLFTMHHLVGDGWSIGVFIDELLEHYEADIERRRCRLPPIRIQYADYVAWQRDSLNDGETARQLEYWKTRLAGIGSPLELPADRARPGEQSFLGAVVSAPVPSSLIARLRGLAQREETTLFTVLLAAFQVLLYRYSHQEDICVGVPVAGRNLLEAEALIGLFVNTVVIRSVLSGNPTFSSLLHDVRNTLLEAHANQDLPFERIVEELQPKRSLSHNPIFQVMMTALEEPRSNRKVAGLTTSQYGAPTSISPLDLTLYVVEAADGSFWWRFQYSTALFDSERISRMIGHYQTLLNAILENPNRRIGDLDLLTAGELEQFSEWNSTAGDYPRKCVHTLIADQAARTPDRVAVVFEDRQLTYAELHRQALRVAAALSAAGAGPGALVGVCIERSLEMIAGVLGVLHCGAAYVPLEPTDPPARLAFKIADAGVKALLSQSSLAERLPPSAAKCVLIEEALATPAKSVPGTHDPESLAYVIFTSGSTGKPKGVCVPHRALANLLNAMQQAPGLGENDRLLAITNLSFDISALELFLPLITGARLVIASKETVADGSRIRESLRRYAITTMQATPSTWRMLIEAGWSAGEGNLKVLCGGEALSPDLAEGLSKRSDSVWNLYGPTETTVWSSRSLVKEQGRPSIGQPIQNTRFYVLDSRMRRVPAGIPGELYIGGDGVANGYLNRPDLSDERFVENPFDAGGGKLYKTGDSVRYRGDGEVEYLGRLDLQVKVRGHRIELGEVESAVALHPGVRRSLALVREDVPGDQQLVCYVVPEPGADLRASELRSTIRDKLPGFMVPGIVVLPSFPLNENAKVDLASLPAPAAEGRASTEPRSDAERQLLSIWKRLLRKQDIGIYDNFFDLGGHSLLAMRLLSEIARVFGQRLPVATLFKAQTVEQMAAVLGERTSDSRVSPGTRPPQPHRPLLFVVPTAAGNAFLYAEFAGHLGSDRPIHVLQPAGLEAAGEPLESIEAMAEHFIRQMRTLQPHGPYHLVGFCLGGIIAFEMAQQLIASGEEAPLLILVETWHPTYVPLVRCAPAARRALTFLVRGLVRRISALLTPSPREVLASLRETCAIAREMILRQDIYRGDRYKRDRDLVVEITHRAVSQYTPTPYSGSVVLILAGNLENNADSDPRMVWGELARGGCAVVRTPASNFGELLKRPHVKVLAESVATRLQEASAAVCPSGSSVS